MSAEQKEDIATETAALKDQAKKPDGLHMKLSQPDSSGHGVSKSAKN